MRQIEGRRAEAVEAFGFTTASGENLAIPALGRILEPSRDHRMTKSYAAVMEG